MQLWCKGVGLRLASTISPYRPRELKGAVLRRLGPVPCSVVADSEAREDAGIAGTAFQIETPPVWTK